MKEEVLVDQLKAGSKEAFDELYAKYKNLAIHTAYLITGNLSDSEDVTQETFVKVWLHARELHNNNGFKAWMMQILVRTAYRIGKKSKKEIPDDETVRRTERSDEVSSLDKVIQQEEAERVSAAVRNLSARLRTVVILYYYDSFTVKEISGILKITEGTVKSRLYTARKRMQSALENDQEKAQRVCGDFAREEDSYGIKTGF